MKAHSWVDFNAIRVDARRRELEEVYIENTLGVALESILTDLPKKQMTAALIMILWLLKNPCNDTIPQDKLLTILNKFLHAIEPTASDITKSTLEEMLRKIRDKYAIIISYAPKKSNNYHGNCYEINPLAYEQYKCIKKRINRLINQHIVNHKKNQGILLTKGYRPKTDCTVFTHLKLSMQNWYDFLQQQLFVNDNKEKVKMRTKIPQGWQPNDGLRRHLIEDHGCRSTWLDSAVQHFTKRNKIKGIESDDWDNFFLNFVLQAKEKGWTFEQSEKPAKKATRREVDENEEVQLWQSNALKEAESLAPVTELDRFKLHIAKIKDKTMAAMLLSNITEVFVNKRTIYLFESRKYLACEKYEGRLQDYVADWYPDVKFVRFKHISELDSVKADAVNFSAPVVEDLDLLSFVKTI